MRCSFHLSTRTERAICYFFIHMVIQTTTLQTMSCVYNLYCMAYLLLFKKFRWVARRTVNSVLDSLKRGCIFMFICMLYVKILQTDLLCLF